MRLSNTILLFFISAALGLFFVSQISNSSTHDRLTLLEGRRSLRTQEDPYPNIDKDDGIARRSMVKANSMPKAYEAISNEDAEIVYNIDYHGVTTHPSPNPKHP